MEPIVNLEENIGKWVGRRRAPDPVRVRPGEKEDARQWRRHGGGIAVPKGVHRFRTHEEADAWLWKMITREKDIPDKLFLRKWAEVHAVELDPPPTDPPSNVPPWVEKFIGWLRRVFRGH